MAFTAKLTEDGNVAQAFRGGSRVPVLLPKASREVEAHNVPSYALTVGEGVSGFKTVQILDGAQVKALDVESSEREKGPNRKLTFRCPGPLLDRLTRHVQGPATIGLAALAEFGLNVLLANNLRLDVRGSRFIDEDSLLLTAKRALRDGEPLPARKPVKKAAKKSR